MARSPKEAIEDLRRHGMSIAEWSRKNNFNPALVYQVLKSSHVPAYGQSHKIAVRLGIKDGVIESDQR